MRALRTRGYVWWTAALVLAIFSQAGSAELPTVTGADIPQFGIYEARVLATDKSAGPPSGTIDRVAWQFTPSTTTVPARKGIRFGYEYRLTGEPDGALVPVRSITIFPPGGMRNPRTGEVFSRSDVTERWAIGSTVLHGYSLDDDWEAVPGTWVLQTWVGEQKVAEMEFTLARSAN
ncbi:DUF3859 domain-containing protein [Bradyrhizobium sp. CCGUVB23]|uniref:DUF3859 domain-containing protein n=1 Tax=Bradyrhizobium sp. CCGUVB23 TaxID=2949630 RepID=UPI0020B28A66|nr:DUF3859 domain-containing protein [Bradyrhizobium sp. CCGUVB23]MCP3467120.1 DUF3859 domain-containing protein [Bradyrhizobium sp. CCGUVB23]